MKRAAMVLGVACGLCSLTSVSGAQPSPAAPSHNAPAPRGGHAMAAAGDAGGTFVLGGSQTPDDPLWQRRDGTWRAMRGVAPVARSMAAAAFDTRRGVLVLYGGAGIRNGSKYGDTWEWDGSAWVEHDVRTPGARDHHAMVFDEARGEVVMFGGLNPTEKTLQSDTWTWNGTEWTRRDVPGPGPLGHHAMAYDSARERIVLVGGIDDAGTPSGDVWEWDGQAWLRVAAPPGPGPRSHIKLAYDTARGVVVMFGGGIPGRNGTQERDTWTWDGTTWRQTALTGPEPRYLHAMAYDATRQKVVLFGGNLSIRPYGLLGDTWEWDGTGWTEVR